MNLKDDSLHKKRFRDLEWGLWGFFGFGICIWASISFIIPEWGYSYQSPILIMVGLAIFFFPIIFYLIFAKIPFEFIRDIKHVMRSDYSLSASELKEKPKENKEEQEYPINSKLDSSVNELLRYSKNSRQFAEDLYTRSGVYLLVGVGVAVSGLFFFYYQTPEFSEVQSLTYLLLLLAPKFGILFFIELVAFFFLKQYRSAMDEFRYYESVARYREEVFCLFQMSVASGQKLDPMELVKYESYFSGALVLSGGQTTELMESKKLEREDWAALSSFAKAMSKMKS